MLKRIWTAPNNGIALSFLKMTGGRDAYVEKRPKHLVAREGAKSDLFIRNTLGVAAISLGSYAFYRYGAFNKERYAHESYHTRDWEKLGVLFLPLYGLASLWAAVKYRNFYEDNWFERRARKAAAESLIS